MSSNDRMLKFIGTVVLLILVVGIIEYTNYNKEKKQKLNETVQNETTYLLENTASGRGVN